MNISVRPILLLSILFQGLSSVFPQEQARGYVYHDLNNNGRRDKREAGIPSVAVSNGREVVLTAGDGSYRLDLQPGDVLFVIKPPDYMYPVNHLNLPQFYYVYEPQGSPSLKFRGVTATGKLPSEINFGLIKTTYTEDFQVALIADPQPYNLSEVEYYEKDICRALRERNDFAFGITLGDLVGDDLNLFEPLNRATATIGKPWFHVIGNHDMNQDATDYRHADATFRRVYGPSTYAFNHGKAHFIILNNVIYPNPYTSASYVGGLRNDQLEFIRNSLQYVPEDYLIVLCMHIPIYVEEKYGETFLLSHRRALFEILKDRPHTLSLSGHTHYLRHYFFGSAEDWLQENPHHHYTTGTASGDWWSGKFQENRVPDATMYDGTPNGYTILSIRGNQYTLDYFSAGNPEEKMRIYGPRFIPYNRHYRGEFFVNFYQGSEKDLVEYSLDGKEWKRMRKTLEFDPYVCALRYEWDQTREVFQGVRPSAPEICHHLWKARVPNNLPPGKHTITIRITDQHGRIYTGYYHPEVLVEE